MFWKKSEPYVHYWSSVPAIEEIAEVQPAPLKKFIPTWWKEIPSSIPGSARHCPAFTDMWSSAYVIPLWGDIEVGYTREGVQAVSAPLFRVDLHEDVQFLDHVPQWMNKEIMTIIKPASPWHVETPKGYSIYQMPMFYDFSKDFITMQGVLHSDAYHQMNPQIAVFKQEANPVLLKRGVPLMIHFPFKRTKYNMKVVERTDEMIYKEAKTNMIAGSKLLGGYRAYTKGYS